MSDIHTRYAAIRFRPDWLARNSAASAWPIIEATALSLSGANCETGIVTWILVQQQVSTMRDTVQTVKTFAFIKLYYTFKFVFQRYSYHGCCTQDRPCHRVCHRSLVVAVLRRGNDERDNDEWRDDGKRKYGRNQLDVASYLACCRIGRRAFLGHLRKEVRHAGGRRKPRPRRPSWLSCRP